MARFEELQELWQSQPVLPAAALEVRGMASELRKFGRRQVVVYIAKLLLIAWQTWIYLTRLGTSWHVLVGQGMLTVAMASMLLTDWRLQMGIARLDFSEASAAFIDRALQQLDDPNAAFRKRFWLYTILIALGLNLALAGRWASDSLQSRLTAHLGLVLLPAAAYAVGLRIRTIRYRFEYRPLRQQLLAMKRALEEQAL